MISYDRGPPQNGSPELNPEPVRRVGPALTDTYKRREGEDLADWELRLRDLHAAEQAQHAAEQLPHVSQIAEKDRPAAFHRAVAAAELAAKPAPYIFDGRRVHELSNHDRRALAQRMGVPATRGVY